MDGFWHRLKQSKKIIKGLSPMDGVTDAPFRYMVAKYSQPDVIYTEFVSVDALYHARNTNRWERVVKAFKYDEIERPIVAQIFGKEPDLFVEAVKLIEKLGFDGVDINMGCPARKVSENGSGAGLIKTPKLAQEIIKVVKASTELPVSVKTRVGVESVGEVESWIGSLLEAGVEVIALHGRSLKQMYTGKADWQAIKLAGEMVHQVGGLILGNGDVRSLDDGLVRAKQYDVDGFLIGRASFGNVGVLAGIEPDKTQRLKWMLEHVKKYAEMFDRVGDKWFLPMRKHLAWYAKGFEGASELRVKLMQCKDVEEVERVVEDVSFDLD